MFEILFTILLFILHGVVNIFEFLCDTWVYVKSRIATTDNISDFCDIKTRTRNLPKIPKHVTILLGTENPSYKDLTNIILWSIAAGIPFISFYDCNGLLKKSEVLFKSEVEKCKNFEDHVIWHNNHTSNYKNGYAGKKIHVKILSPLDGRIQFANVCRNLSECDKNESIDMKYLDSNLRKYYEFPDPDLGIYCGKSFSLFDYPPWQISVTEFLNVTSHHDLPLINFIDILNRYSKCEQRLGT